MVSMTHQVKGHHETPLISIYFYLFMHSSTNQGADSEQPPGATANA